MSHDVRFLPLARLEVTDVCDWYARLAPGLSEGFLTEVDRIVGLIADNPLVYPVVLKDIRRARLRRFPYSLFFRIVGDDCFVLACFHARRDPRRWEDLA